MDVSSITQYFPELTEHQIKQFETLHDILIIENTKVNLVSRKDIGELYIRHILHGLALAKVMPIKKGDTILDFGTGGGIPGLPLAIYFPEARFTLVDSTRKKTDAVQTIVDEMELKNVRVYNSRVEELDLKFDFITCRAVARLEKLLELTRKMLNARSGNNKSGYYLLKGGELAEEIEETGMEWKTDNISTWFNEEFFETKKVLSWY